MKKKLYKLLIFVLVLILNLETVSASTNTYTRSEEDLLTPPKVSVTEKNKQTVLETPAVDASEKIYDFADLFTSDEEDRLYREVSSFINNYDMDLAIVTIDDNNKYSEVEYADDFYDYNDFKINGLLFLIDMDNRKIYMSTTGNAINMYNDYRIDDILDQVYSYMSDEEYYEGTSEFISIIKDYAKKGYPTNNEKETKYALPVSLIISFIITFAIMFSFIRKNKLVRKATTAINYLDNDSVLITNLGDKYIGSNTVRTKIDHSDSSGGSSTHSGSSGISHGGGGHGF